MEKSIITFSANEQNLQKTGGIGCYASDTVSYIEAHFALGENWSGYDSIRAVWFNDYKTISTVLDFNGVCIVPHEVLTSRGKVMVNLVGSVLVSDELSDRLTTFPCEALKVSAKAKISGSETAAVTPSQFEQFVSMVISEVEKVTGMTAQAETLPAGSQATARYEDGILYLGIPQGIRGERGETGADGADGNGIASVVYNADYSLTLVFDNGERFTTPPIRGERGPAGQDGRDGTDGADGVTPNISIGNVETLEPSEDAYVTRRGTDANPIFDFGIPKGDKGDPGEVTMSQLSALLPTDTASGAIASFPDGQSVIPALSVVAEIDPIQDLHGYDAPWVGGAGKNKLPNTATSGTVANVTYTVNSDGTIIANGTSNSWSALTIGTVTLPSGTYWLTSGIISSDNYIEFVLNGSNVNTNSLSRRQFTLTQSTEITVKLYTRPNKTATNLKLYPMIYLDSETDTTYAPYENICPISGRTEVNTIVSPTTSASDGRTYTTALGQTVYGGTLDVVSGELVVDRAMVDLGTLNWTYDGTSYAYGFFTSSAVSNRKAGSLGVAVCSNYAVNRGGRYSLGGANGQIASFNETNANAVCVRDDSYIDATAFKTAMNGVQLVYELANPQTYQLDPQTISLLHGDNNVWSDGSVEVTYNADVGLYIDKKLGTSGTRTLSTTRTLDTKSEDTDDTKSDNIQLAED